MKICIVPIQCSQTGGFKWVTHDQKIVKKVIH